MSTPSIVSVALKVGLEVHVELSTRTKMFSRCPNPAFAGVHVQQGRVELDEDFGETEGLAANSLIDPVVLGLPGALPVMNKSAVEMSILVGLALNCSIASRTKWDRKSYFYPDLPKAYQISQYDLPLCFDGAVDVPLMDEKGQVVLDASGRMDVARIGIMRAHLEEDAGKLLHEAPGGGRIDFSIVDWNRAGTPLLEIVTQPDFTSAERVVSFARQLRTLVRFLGVSEADMQKGHIRFEPNINCVLTLSDGRTVATPIVEVKNLNSFKALRGAIEFELREQPGRWQADGRVMGRGMKTTRGWDDGGQRTFVQREKEDAHDYRYFPDPDLPPVVVDAAWLESLKSRLPEPPLKRQQRYVDDYGLGAKEAAALIDDRDINVLYEGAIRAMVELGLDAPRAGKVAANFVLQSGLKRANERARELGREVGVHELGIAPAEIAAIGKLREDGKVNSNAADELFGELCASEGGVAGRDQSEAGAVLARVEGLARQRGVLIEHDPGAVERWVEAAIGEHAQAAADVRAGKMQAVGRLVGAAMKHAGGKGDAKAVREALLKKLGQAGG